MRAKLRGEYPVERIVVKVKEIKIKSDIGKASAKNASTIFPLKCGNTGLSAKVAPRTLNPRPTIEASNSSRIVNLRVGVNTLGIAIMAHG